MLANGDGTFREPVIVESHQGSPAVAAVADATHDGLADLVVASPDGRGVDVLAGTGDGALHQAARYAFTTPRAWTLVAIAVADMNGDGLSDIVASSDRHGEAAGIITVALSSPGGSLEASGLSRLAGPAPRRLRVADIDGDGALDVVAARDGGSVQAGAMPGVAVLLGSGNGRLQPPAVYPSDGAAITDIAIADVTGDRKSDVILFGWRRHDSGAGEHGSWRVRAAAISLWVLRHLSKRVRPRPHAARSRSTTWMATAGPTSWSLVARNVCPAQVMTLTGNGDGSFQSPVAHGTGGPDTGLLVTANLDGDENLDVSVFELANRRARGGFQLGGVASTPSSARYRFISRSMNAFPPTNVWRARRSR